MTTREDLSDAALRRLDATVKEEKTARAMALAYREFKTARDAHESAVAERVKATRHHAEIEQQLIQQQRTEHEHASESD